MSSQAKLNHSPTQIYSAILNNLMPDCSVERLDEFFREMLWILKDS